MSTTREAAVAVVNTFDWKCDVEGLVICDPRVLADAIDKALQARDERAVKIVEPHLNCAEHGGSCAKRIIRTIREGKPQE